MFKKFKDYIIPKLVLYIFIGLSYAHTLVKYLKEGEISKSGIVTSLIIVIIVFLGYALEEVTKIIDKNNKEEK